MCVCFWCLSMHTHRYTHAADKERSPAQWSSGLKQAQAYPYSIYLSAFPSPCRHRPVPSTLSAVPHHSRPSSVTSRPARIEIYTPFVWEAGMLLSGASLCLEEFGWFAFFQSLFVYCHAVRRISSLFFTFSVLRGHFVWFCTATILRFVCRFSFGRDPTHPISHFLIFFGKRGKLHRHLNLEKRKKKQASKQKKMKNPSQTKTTRSA